MLVDRYFGVLTGRGGACGRVRKGALWLVTVFVFYIKRYILFRKIICSTVPGLSLFLFLLTTPLAFEKTRSQGTEEAGVQRVPRANT